MSLKRRVVVTGMGAITPVGNDVATTWRAITAGVSGGAPIEVHGLEELRGEVDGEVGAVVADLAGERRPVPGPYAVRQRIHIERSPGFRHY